MKKVNELYMKNKKEKSVYKKFKLSNYFNSILKISIALALFVMAAFFISGAGLIVENGALNVSNNLLVNSNTLFVDSVNDLVGIGTVSPSFNLEVVKSGNDSNIATTAYGTSVTPAFLGRLARGTQNVPTAIQSSDTLLFIGGRGYGSTGFSSISRAAIIFYASQNWNDTAQGTYISFETTPDGSTSRQKRMRITASGNVGIGTTTPNQKLMVAGNANITGTLYYGALQANSPILETTSEPFVARCTIADDGKLVVEYVHFEDGKYSKVIEAVNADSNLWWHRSCYEKSEKLKFLSNLKQECGSGDEVHECTIDDLGFDWGIKRVFVR